MLSFYVEAIAGKLLGGSIFTHYYKTFGLVKRWRHFLI